MDLESEFSGHAAFEKYSLCFQKHWETFSKKEELLNLIGNDLVLARPMAYHFGENFSVWFDRKIPALSNLTPAECMQSANGILRLKTCIQRMP